MTNCSLLFRGSVLHEPLPASLRCKAPGLSNSVSKIQAKIPLGAVINDKRLFAGFYQIVATRDCPVRFVHDANQSSQIAKKSTVAGVPTICLPTRQIRTGVRSL